MEDLEGFRVSGVPSKKEDEGVEKRLFGSPGDGSGRDEAAMAGRSSFSCSGVFDIVSLALEEEDEEEELQQLASHVRNAVKKEE